ncbi:hypothetical protein I314_06335 [Cryptococcus bacillisporus CA1873]|uniref:F-box domain-containing protein n=1 Tax=Cryptococcus bacillisporus CA1873 TaxID=1296111 RepID=A0ABR5B2K8_CRYGA|nr:hypothetical protein I314_06335 [Cryptococcus bacillisporus CA1873]|eukprot:KIR57831.1 hypothetical protein I314_06335 [Cryptococcus gattii CA1873]
MREPPNIPLTTLAPIHEVHHLIFREIDPLHLLTLSKSIFNYLLPKLYHTLPVDSTNVKQILYGVTSPGGYKAGALSYVKRLEIGIDGRGDRLRTALHDLFELSSLPRPLFSRLEHIHFGHSLWEPYDGPNGMFEALLPSYIPPCHISFDLCLFPTEQIWSNRDYNLSRQRRLTNFLLMFFHETSASHITFRVFHPSDCTKSGRPYREVDWDVQGESKVSADLHMLREWVVPRLLRRSEEELREELKGFFEKGMEDRFKFLHDDTIAWDWKKRYVVSVRDEKLEGEDISE